MPIVPRHRIFIGFRGGDADRHRALTAFLCKSYAPAETATSKSYGRRGHAPGMRSKLRAMDGESAGSAADAVLVEIAELLAAHLAVALAVCLALDLCDA